MKKLFLLGAVASIALVGCSSEESVPDEVAITMTAEEVYATTVDGVGMTPMVMDADVCSNLLCLLPQGFTSC